MLDESRDADSVGRSDEAGAVASTEYVGGCMMGEVIETTACDLCTTAHSTDPFPRAEIQLRFDSVRRLLLKKRRGKRSCFFIKRTRNQVVVFDRRSQ